MTDNLPRGTVTFLFTDIESSTALWEEDSPAMRAAVERRLTLLDAAIAARGGSRYEQVGDAIQAAFATAGDGIGAAIDAQRALIEEPWQLPHPIRVRMALHAGEAASHAAGQYHQVPALKRCLVRRSGPVVDPALVLPAIAATPGVRESCVGNPEDALIAYLRPKLMLLPLDNFEQVVAAASHVSTLLTACPRLTVLATSREPLLPLPWHRAINEVVSLARELKCARSPQPPPGFPGR